MLCMAPAQDGTLEASQQQRDARTRALAAGVAACIPEDIFTASLLGAEAVLVLSQTCWFFKLLLKGAERRRVRGALQLVRFDYVRKDIAKGVACNLYREQGRTHDPSASEVAWCLMWMPHDAAYVMLTGMSSCDLESEIKSR